jgi:hypothetical protein
MSGPRLEKRKGAGTVLVTDARVAPIGYVRDGKVRVKSRGDWIEFTPEDLERLAKELRETNEGRRVVRLHKTEVVMLASRA